MTSPLMGWLVVHWTGSELDRLHTDADVPHLLGDLDLHVAAVALLSGPLVVLCDTAIIPQGL